MSRKLRFFKDQINKAGLMSSLHTVLQPDIELEDLEVSFNFTDCFLLDLITFVGFVFNLHVVMLPAMT